MSRTVCIVIETLMGRETSTANEKRVCVKKRTFQMMSLTEDFYDCLSFSEQQLYPKFNQILTITIKRHILFVFV